MSPIAFERQKTIFHLAFRYSEAVFNRRLEIFAICGKGERIPKKALKEEDCRERRGVGVKIA